jgi:hypothetical protein
LRRAIRRTRVIIYVKALFCIIILNQTANVIIFYKKQANGINFKYSVAQSNLISFWECLKRISSGQMLDCTSPICFFLRKNMQSLDCPIPPPILKGS